MSKVAVVQNIINGGAVLSIPGSTMEVMWIGPGSDRMFIGYPRKAGGVVMPIEHPTCIGPFKNVREAVAALQKFVDISEAEESA